MIDLEKLQAFLYAADNLSFSEAAKHLHLTQPTISYHVKELEKDLGTELFDRSGPRLQLTEAGRLLIPWARKLIRQSIEIQDMMSSLEERIVGHLGMACSTTAGKYILPQLAARFCAKYPWIHVSILACTPESVLLHLLNREAHLGVVSSYQPCEENDGLECQAFFDDAITLIVPGNHPWAKRDSIQPEELLEERMIIREPTSGTRRVLLSELAKYDITLDDLNIFLELGNAEAIVRTVAAGYGISFVSTLARACPLDRGSVVDVPVVGLDLRRKIYMIRRSLAPPHRPLEAFWSFIHEPANADLLRMPETH
jgi:DNA-binding transcriptional LysR family regulator